MCRKPIKAYSHFEHVVVGALIALTTVSFLVITWIFSAAL
jgi:hypothetical protein